jgi:ABC-type antimicrobial peptide transport system ATPase subunit
LSAGRKELVETKGRNRQLEKDHGELKENWRVMNEHTRRREMELEKLEIRAKNYVIENDQIRIMNEELKQMIDMRKVET